jgi:hypothetical protein
MSFLIGRPGILVADHLSRHRARVRYRVSAIPPTGFAGRTIRVIQ